MTFSVRLLVVPLYLALCLVLGGASAAGYPANLVLQLLAIPIIAWSLLARRTTPIPSASRQLLILTVAMLVLIGLQLVPLPPGLWSSLAGRDEARTGLELLGIPLPWHALSLTPDRTVASALWLLPALAVLFAMIRPGAYKPEYLVAVLLTVTLIAIALGAVQRAGNSAAYFYQITNVGMGTGFFSNGNHMATLLMASTPFLVALYLAFRNTSRSPQRNSALLVILVGTMGVLVVGLAINGSLAGLGLSVAVLGASGLMLLSRKRRVPAWAILPLVLIAVGGVVIVFVSPIGNDFTSDLQDISISRSTFFPNTLQAAMDYLPFGSGIGSFATVYPLYEDHGIVTRTFANHAHSDILELLLETGIPGMLLLLLFLLWWLRRVVAIWLSEEVDQFGRAATIATAAIMGHSLVDYPLRTAALSAVFAMCCALMADARPWVRPSRKESKSGPRHLSAD